MADVSALPYHRKYRPNTLSHYIGNEKLKETAMKTLRGSRPQVIMLYGASGCGKTTFARLLAKEYCCYDRDLETGACGVCESCQQFDEYIATGVADTFANVHEVNVAAKRGVGDLDDIFEDMTIPVYGEDEWKVYIFDECHKASNALQNRFLKIVEEPPENILIIFCTTNPEEMIDTLKNRCQLTLKVEKPTVKELAGLLKTVCNAEGVESDRQGLEFLANRGELTIRTALQNLWRVVSEQGGAHYKDVIKVFDEVSNTLMIEFFKALKAKDTLRYVTLLCDAKARVDIEVFFTDLKDFVLRGIYTINNVKLDGVSDGELKAYRTLFGDLGVVQISSFLDRLLRLDMHNLELELLALGYTGFDAQSTSDDIKIDIKPLDDELKEEEANANKVLQSKEAESYEAGVENATKQMDSVGVDLLLSMGGQLVGV